VDQRTGVKSHLEATLTRAFYFSDDIYAREKDRIFFSEWFCAGREEQIPKPGDYLLAEVAGERIVVVRTKDGELRAHFNTCRHRGCQLVLHESAQPNATSGVGPLGTFPGAIRCPYHAWTYTVSYTHLTLPTNREV